MHRDLPSVVMRFYEPFALLEGELGGPLFNLIIADGLVFGRAADLKTQDSQRFHGIRESWGWS